MMPKAFDDRADDETQAAVADVLGKLASAGAQIEAIEEPPAFTEIRANALVLMCAEAGDVHGERFGEKKDLYGPSFVSSLREVSIFGLANIFEH